MRHDPRGVAADAGALPVGDGWRMRLATAADNPALCALFREVDMAADLCLAEERDPDFFALLNAHSGAPRTVILEHAQTGAALGCASIIARDAWLDGEIRRIGYACDLRIQPGLRGDQVSAQVIGGFMDYMRHHEGIELMYAAVLSSNQRARQALLGRSGARAGQPDAQVMTAYDMVSVQFLGRMAKPEPHVRRATPADRLTLLAFLAQQQRARVLGEVVDEAWLDRRLAQWPGFCLEDFFLLTDAQGRILACTAPWDTAAHVRRSRVLRYQGRMPWLKAAYNLEARLRGGLPLPGEGECFRFAYLTHLEVAQDNPVWLNRLLRGVYAHLQDNALHFMSLMVPKGSTLQAGLKGFRCQRIAMELIAFTRPDSPVHGRSLSTLRPGFEMALH